MLLFQNDRNEINITAKKSETHLLTFFLKDDSDLK
jgi:hypothetical protein